MTSRNRSSMELDNLKELWKDSNKSSIPIDEDKLRQILSTSSNGPIAKMKRNLKLEVISLIIVYGLLLWATSNEVDSIFTTFDFVLLLVTGMLFIIYASIYIVSILFNFFFKIIRKTVLCKNGMNFCIMLSFNP